MSSSAIKPSNDRIRRTNDDPVVEKPRFRTTTTLVILRKEEQLELRYHRSRWQSDRDVPGVHQRILQSRLYLNGCHAGSFLLTEVRPEPLIANDRFLEWADVRSAEMLDLAETICEHWVDVSEVSDFGTILELTRAWMSPRFSSGERFSLAANALAALSAEWSLLVLKAFPLEYEGMVTDLNKDAHKRRQKAMVRHYRSTLGVEPFPEEAGDEGWMYLIGAGLPIARPQRGSHLQCWD